MAISVRKQNARSASFLVPSAAAGAPFTLNALAALLDDSALKTALAVASASQTASWIADNMLSISCTQGYSLSAAGTLTLDAAADTALRISLSHSLTR